MSSEEGNNNNLELENGYDILFPGSINNKQKDENEEDNPSSSTKRKVKHKKTAKKAKKVQTNDDNVEEDDDVILIAKKDVDDIKSNNEILSQNLSEIIKNIRSVQYDAISLTYKNNLQLSKLSKEQANLVQEQKQIYDRIHLISESLSEKIEKMKNKMIKKNIGKKVNEISSEKIIKINKVLIKNASKTGNQLKNEISVLESKIIKSQIIKNKEGGGINETKKDELENELKSIIEKNQNLNKELTFLKKNQTYCDNNCLKVKEALQNELQKLKNELKKENKCKEIFREKENEILKKKR